MQLEAISRHQRQNVHGAHLPGPFFSAQASNSAVESAPPLSAKSPGASRDGMQPVPPRQGLAHGGVRARAVHAPVAALLAVGLGVGETAIAFDPPA